MARALVSPGCYLKRPLLGTPLKFASLFLALGFVNVQNASAQVELVTSEDIKRISPGAKDEFVQAIINADEKLKAAGITTRLRMAHFITQVMTETGGLGRIDENMNYSFGTLMRVFSRNVISEDKAQQIAGSPRAIANWVYGSRLGNRGRDTDDGWDYRGSGFIQLTGRKNFRDRGSEIGLPLERNPELARQAREGMLAAIAYWDARRINEAADDHDQLRVRVLVNGRAAHGFEQSKVWFARAWTRAFRNKGAAGFESGEELAGRQTVDEEALFDDILKRNGVMAEDALESAVNPADVRSEALKRFQRDVGLPETGVRDEATERELLDPREWRHRDGPEALRPGPQIELEQTIVFPVYEPSQAASATALEPFPGTGQTVADVNIQPSDDRAMSEASGMYSQYEMGGTNIPESFVPFSIIDADDRRAVPDTTGFPARAVVQILFETPAGSQHLCSGTMVSKDTVVTAGHCLHSGTSTGQLFRNFRVTPGRNRGAAPFGNCRARDIFVLQGWTRSITAEEARYYDLGGLKLDCNIGEATGWLGVRALDDKDLGLKATVHGYAADKTPRGQQWVSDDQIRLLWTLKGFYKSDTFGGTSGSPVYAAGADNVFVGVHTNGIHGAEEPWATHNAFTRITPERLSLIRRWIQY
jgi:putative chitinase